MTRRSFVAALSLCLLSAQPSFGPAI